MRKWIAVPILAWATTAGAQMGPGDCLSVSINWMNYIGPLGASNISDEKLREAKQALLDVRPDMPEDLSRAVDRLVAANEELAENPKSWEDPSHPLNTGEFEEISLMYEKAMRKACPEPE
ncbi:hypothetical protein [Chromohalobacter israelensis]|uniref:hypothetical protein n=1 Tax=Chromohalobacter israelensis TaxID=141390 RepID=UPI0015C43511|nr:hypothetical protein [Chromohalobacter salexigens]NWO57337.1 hypothetical protein [Chromohalobacter salexigens]